jgi:acyl-coenzyme A thioesterase PaaI-like protein
MARIPGGRWIFSRMLGRLVPYSGTLSASIELLEPGRAVVRLRDRRRVRNHLGSVHAVALTNLGELASGLATLTALPPEVRGIVTALATRYHRKARGVLVAEARAALPRPLALPVEVVVEAAIRDGAGEVVADVRATWLLGATP